MKKIISIIPARGGSKRIPKKNLKLLDRKPLIYYTIQEALKSRYLDRIIVSTEDEEIAEVSRKHGAEVIERPKDLARDESPTIDAILHALDFLGKDGYVPEIVVLLQPTCPLRNGQDIDNAIELFLKKNCESVVSVCEIGHSPYWIFKIEDEYLKAIFEEKYLKMRRQDLPKVYMPNGAIYISTPENLRKYESFYCSKIIPYMMPIERSIDIDNEIDFILAELVIKKYGFE